MRADVILSQLRKVRQTGADEWVACCPAHDDRSPSLAIRDNGDKVLLHCFSGCSANDVLGALGLAFTDLFDQPLDHHVAPVRRPFNPATVLAALARETAIVGIAAEDAAKDRLTDVDRARMWVAIGRIQEAAQHG